MDTANRKTVCVVSTLLIGFFINGCGEPSRERTPKLATETELGATIGSLAEIFPPEPIPVTGYGVVGGLSGTGSAECPPRIAAYLKQYILRQPSERKIDIDGFINSHNTAVVWLEGTIPAMASKNQRFDMRVVALPGTQTTSLEGGWLYTAELRAAAGPGTTTRVLARAEGPVFIDTLADIAPDKKTGYILAGGTALNEYKINVVLRRADFRTADLIRDRLNQRFGPNTARAVSPIRIELIVPAEYANRKKRFTSMVEAMYLVETPEINEKRISTFVRKLAASEEKQASEIALEVIGNECLEKVAILLNSSDEQVRLRAARCMLNLGNNRGLDTLRAIVVNKNSPYRIEALEAITTSASRNNAAVISRLLLRDKDFDIRLAAYENLRKLDDIAIARTPIARSFYLEQIAQTEYKAIFVSRSGRPRIVLFGAPIYCLDDIFIESADGNITINAPAGQKYVSIMRKHPTRPVMIGPLKSSLELGDIIQTLCEEPVKETEQRRPGLGVSYADMIALLKQMCDKGVVRAEFRAGPPPKINPIIKK